ncbi:MAG: hypothetical protein IJ174_02550, partial [Clostridia bacterium]|nr:hypothetical protein [Clostridia bacterium]
MREDVIEMVNRLFENLTMTDEVAALREEVLNNCLDRYSDLIAGGADEAEALSSVRESLSGMEEMLSEFPKTEVEPAGGFGPEAFEKTESKPLETSAFEKPVNAAAEDDASIKT